jgi:hypothetical protein
MEIVISNHHLIAPAGVDTYMLTVAEELQRLGHEVTAFALEQGTMADHFRDRGIRVARSQAELPPQTDVVFAQDTVTALELRATYPQTPQVFVAHSDVWSNGLPPAAPGVSQAVVAMSDRVQRHVQAMDQGLPIHRLRQPIDVGRFAPTGLSRPQARRVVLIGNYVHGFRRQILEETCEELGLELSMFGLEAGATWAPEQAMNEADIVVGQARVVVEAMACGRAAYVYDFLGCDGWMTPGNYAALEADAFTGQATDDVVDRDRLRRELASYTPEMGVANRDLAVLHHRVEDHAQALVDIFKDLGPPVRRDPAPFRDLALVTRQSWLHDAFSHHLHRQTEHLRAMLEAETKARAVDREADRVLIARLEEQRRELEDKVRVAEAQRDEALHTLERVQRSDRYRLAGSLALPLERIRERRRRP